MLLSFSTSERHRERSQKLFAVYVHACKII